MNLHTPERGADETQGQYRQRRLDSRAAVNRITKPERDVMREDRTMLDRAPRISAGLPELMLRMFKRFRGAR